MVLILCVSVLSSCTTSNRTISVGKAEVAEEIYNYFSYTVSLDNPNLGVDEKAVVVKTEVLKYVATNSKFKDLSLSLTTVQKAEVSTTVNNYWHLFGDYYESIDISKQTINKIELNKAYKKILLKSVFDTNGTQPTSEEDIKKYFSDNFVVFKAISGYFESVDESGNAVEMSQTEIATITSQFEQMKESVDGGTSFDQVNKAYQSSSDGMEVEDVQSSIVGKGSKTYPTGFFDKVSAIERGKTSNFTLGKYIFLIIRENEFESDYYSTYRDESLAGLKADAFEQIIEQWAKVLE